VQVSGLSGAIAIATGGNHTCAATSVTIGCWGSNHFGQLGTGTTEDSNVPVGIVPW